MDNFDIPILKKSFDLYKAIYDYRKLVPKINRHTICERNENLTLEVVENLIEAGHLPPTDKIPSLRRASTKLNTLRFLIRLMKETRICDTKKYVALQEKIDEIGRMLGGWIRSSSAK